MDAFFEVNSIKYLYMFLLIFGVFFMRTGRGFASGKSQGSGDMQSVLWVTTVIYFTFLTLLMIFQNGSPQLIFKIVSPFIFFGLVVAAADDSLPFAIAVGSVINIVANAALLPFDYGWVYWGAVHTFKGFYLFKTDLSYSVTTSLLAFAAWNRYRLTPLYIALAVLAVVQVMLANSRLNYLTMAVVLVFVALKNGAKPKTLLVYAGFLGVLAAVAWKLYSSSKGLTFDTSNLEGFTQGRDRVMSVLLKYGLASYSPLEWLFGRGLYADLVIFMENVSGGEVYGSHNEFLYLIVTQGVTGLVLNVTAWWMVYKISQSAGVQHWASGLAAVAFLLYFIQGLTTTMSTYALKTWPLATILVLIFASKDQAPLPAQPKSAMQR
ncbi:O-antigen ligase family protein [Aquabacterium sp.]|uniref:O-antigen ligase family protein n=1 Tax=Aquabacterium sp. TaxID=1872578 RepID=UPI00199479D9|nr:O-antigen ligase family protein [Aquabacterium sp.]MBC7702101.1 O-antigen ligase family protein [Aquabacterium sp.]